MGPRINDLLQFIARSALYLVLPGLWLAYVGGVPPWLGGVAGLAGIFLLGVSLQIRRDRRGRSPRNRLEELFQD